MESMPEPLPSSCEYRRVSTFSSSPKRGLFGEVPSGSRLRINVSGGSVSYELGSAVHDTVELRDGSVLNGDVESISATEVVVRTGGTT